MIDLLIYFIGFSCGLMAYHFGQNAFLNSKIALLNHLKMDVHSLMVKLHNLADLMKVQNRNGG